MTEHLFDILLAVALVWLAWRVLATARLFKSVVLFIAFGLLMALAWARLAAPDIALAEAAIGAGLTGALLLDAVAQMNRSPLPEDPETHREAEADSAPPEGRRDGRPPDEEDSHGPG
jgi:energy-converting hydrogenase B subunit D